MSTKRKVLLVIIIIIAGIALAGAVAKARIERNLDRLADLAINDVDLAKVSDGVYTGSYKAFPVAATVKVTVSDHVITGIELVEHSNGQGASAEIIPDKVVEAQTLQVDAVSGATYSSKVILKAIEAALNSASE